MQLLTHIELWAHIAIVGEAWMERVLSGKYVLFLRKDIKSRQAKLVEN